MYFVCIPLEYLVDLDIVALVLAEVFSVHISSIWVNILLKKSVNSITNIICFLCVLVPEYGCSNDEFKQLVSADVSLRRLLILMNTHIGRNKQQIESCKADVLMVKNVCLISEGSDIVQRNPRVIRSTSIEVENVDDLKVVLKQFIYHSL